MLGVNVALPRTAAGTTGATFDWYVDAKNGSDSTGDGSLDAPLQSIQKAVDSLSDGQSIGLLGGDSPDEYHLAQSVGRAAAVAFRVGRVPGHFPVVHGSTYIAGGEFSKTAGQTHVYQATRSLGTIWALAYNGHPQHHPMGEVAGIAACDALENSFYYDAGTTTFYVHASGGGAPDHVWVINGVQRCFNNKDNDKGITLENLTFKFAAGVLAENKTVGGGHANVMRNLTLRCFGSRPGTGDTAFSCAYAGASLALQNVNYRECYHKGSGSGPNIAGQGVIITDATAAVEMANCTFKDVYRAFYGQAGSSSLLGYYVENCFTRTEQAHSLTLRGFEIKRCQDDHLDLRDASLEVSYGLVWMDTSYTPTGSPRGISLSAGGSQRITHVVVEGFVDADHLGEAAAFYLGTDNAVTIRNCAAVNCGVGVYVPAGSTPTLDLEYLGFYGNNDDYVNVAAGDQAENVVLSDPRFTDESINDYTLMADSPYIDAGVAVAGINDDYVGGAPDIGRYETA